MTGLSSLLSNVTTSNQAVASTAQPGPQLQQHNQPTIDQLAMRTISNRKSVAVLKETTVSNLLPQEKHIVEPKKSMPSLAPNPPVHRELPPPPKPHPLPSEIGFQPCLESVKDRYTDTLEVQKAPLIPQSPENIKDAPAAQAVSHYKQSCDPIVQSRTYSSGLIQDVIEPANPAKAPAENHTVTRIPLSDHIPTNNTSSHYPEATRRHNLPPVSEPEEYWEEEEIAEGYEEDGYVTARSFKSRGENTTGGATTIIFPKLNQRARKEIAMAKELIEGSKTVEELEDEAWDTTMVAEYGDEIFEYMRNLEVSGVSFRLEACLHKYRSRCFLTHIIWTIKPKYNGQCGLF